MISPPIPFSFPEIFFFYEHIFPYADSSHPTTSYLDDFVFPHCTLDLPPYVDPINPISSIDSHISIPNTLPATPSNETSNPSTAAPPASSAAPSDAAPSAALDAAPNAATGAAPNAASSAPPSVSPADLHLAEAAPNAAPGAAPTAATSAPPSTSNSTLRRSNRPHKPPPYLSQYACKSVSSKPNSGLPYDISFYLDYSHLGPTFKSFVMAVNSTPSDPTYFHQAVQYPEWRAAMDKEIEALEVTNTWSLVPLPPGKRPIGCK